MSWISDVTKEMQVFMGDGETYRPEWLNAKIKTSYNVSTFEFPGIEGTLVQRQKKKGEVYDIELYFQGDDNLDVANKFKISADDPRHWHIRHPFYGDLRVQPISGLSLDNTEYNVTKITGTVQETIIGIFPRSLDNPTDQIAAAAIEVANFGSESYANSVQNPSPSNVANAGASVDQLDQSTKRLITADEDSAKFQNLVKRAKSDVSKMSSNAFIAMQSVQSVIEFPARMEASLTSRILLLKDQFDQTSNAIRNLNYVIPLSERFYYETFAGTIVSTLLQSSSITTTSDYETSNDVDSVIVTIIEIWNAYLLDLDSLQFFDPASVDSYLPDSNFISSLDSMLSLTLSNLFVIALESKKEIVILTEKDSNAILLTFRYYGLDSNDDNLDFFLRTNSIGLSEMLLIPKGSKILYYL